MFAIETRVFPYHAPYTCVMSFLPKQYITLLNIRSGFQNTLRALWKEARHGFDVHYYKNIIDAEALSVYALPARALAFNRIKELRLLNADALAGIAKPDRASASIIALILMNAKSMSGFVLKRPQGLLKVCC